MTAPVASGGGLKASDIRAALAKKFAAPEYALFFEVGDATGGRARRWADAVAMGLWPSRGLALQGFEIKVSRSDLMSELKNPAKAESVARYCRYWWLATPPGLVREGELPEGWGLYEAHPNGLRCIKQAPSLDISPISPQFLAALLRRADERDRQLDSEAIAKAIDRDEQRTKERIERAVEHQTRNLRRRAEGAEVSLKAIHAACGLADGEATGLWFNDRGFAEAVAMVHRLGVANTYGKLHMAAKQLLPLADVLRELVPPEHDGVPA